MIFYVIFFLILLNPHNLSQRVTSMKKVCPLSSTHHSTFQQGLYASRTIYKYKNVVAE